MTKNSPVLTFHNMAAGVTTFSSTRKGGYSCGCHGGFNVNEHCGDEPENVARNRALLCDMLGIESRRLVMPHQTHGTATRMIAEDFFTLSDATRLMLLEGIDAVMTDVPGVCVGVSTADCIPILLYDEAHRAVSAVHAGWRGTAARIVEKNIAEMAAAYGTRPSDLRAVIGPGISLENFEVGDEVCDEFRKAGFDMAKISRKYDKWHIDLWECNRIQLLEAGVTSSGISIAGICTYSHADEYFSARRLGTMSGRILNGIMIDKE
ncbi:MAG: peptidoglycan editing factor PgeF [Prevotella sp.]